MPRHVLTALRGEPRAAWLGELERLVEDVFLVDELVDVGQLAGLFDHVDVAHVVAVGAEEADHVSIDELLGDLFDFWAVGSGEGTDVAL